MEAGSRRYRLSCPLSIACSAAGAGTSQQGYHHRLKSPGWESLIPIYIVVVMLRIAGMPERWIILMLIPFVNLVVAIMALVATAERFGKSTGLAMGMLFLPIIFVTILAFGDATYHG